MKHIQKYVMSVLGALAIFVGASSASSATVMLIHQPKCPEHLIK